MWKQDWDIYRGPYMEAPSSCAHSSTKVTFLPSSPPIWELGSAFNFRLSWSLSGPLSQATHFSPSLISFPSNISSTPHLNSSLKNANPEKNMVRKDTCTPMFIVALFTIAKTWKQPKCPSTEEWIKKLWYIYTMEYYSVIKKNEIKAFAATWMDLEIVILSEVKVRQRERNIIWYRLYAESKKKWYKWTYLQNRNRLTDLENELMVTMGEGCQGGIVREFGIDMYTLLYLK